MVARKASFQRRCERSRRSSRSVRQANRSSVIAASLDSAVGPHPAPRRRSHTRAHTRARTAPSYYATGMDVPAATARLGWRTVTTVTYLVVASTSWVRYESCRDPPLQSQPQSTKGDLHDDVEGSFRVAGGVPDGPRNA